MIYVPSFGPERARIMAVGEAPGGTEEELGRPFVGPTGQLLRDFLQQVGVDPEEVFYTNICKIRPPENKLERFFFDGGIPNHHVMNGLEELTHEILRVRPHVILSLGNFPLWALTGKAQWKDEVRDGKKIRGYSGIMDYRGSILRCVLEEAEGFKVVPTFHPSFIYQEGWKHNPSFLMDLERAARESAFPEIRRPHIEVLLAEEQPRRLLNYWDVMDEGSEPQWELHHETRFDLQHRLLKHDGEVTLDIEYVGSKLLCCGLATRADEGIVIPTRNLGDIQFMSDTVRGLERINAQNSMFDASVLEWHYGVEVMSRVTFDTMIAQYVAHIELPKGLDYLASIYTDHPYYKGMINWKAIAKGAQAPEALYVYNGGDLYTQHVTMEQQKLHELSDPIVDKSFQFLMRMLVPLWHMSKRGIRIDLKMMKGASKLLRQEAAEESIELMLLCNRSELINVKSGPQVSHLLFNELGLKPLKKNRTGPSVDDKTLAALQLKAPPEAREIIRLIRSIRSKRDLRSKFFNIEFDSDNRMRGHYDPTKTVTGRLASRKFYPTGKGTNQQNIPRDKRSRRVFIADPEKVFIYADLERAESLVVAHLTGDARMLHDHSPGQNAHRNLGLVLFDRDNPEDITEDEYYLSKKTRHAGNYMEGPVTLMRDINKDAHKTGVSVTQSKASDLIQRYKEVHPGLPAWWSSTEDYVKANKCLYNLLGFRRWFYDRIRSTLPKIIAFVPQSTVGQTLNVAFMNLEGRPTPYMEDLGLWDEYKRLNEELVDCGMENLQQIHDAVGMQVWRDDLERAAPLIRRAMAVPLKNPRTGEFFTIPVEIAAATEPPKGWEGQWNSNWGDVKKYERDLLNAPQAR